MGMILERVGIPKIVDKPGRAVALQDARSEGVKAQNSVCVIRRDSAKVGVLVENGCCCLGMGTMDHVRILRQCFPSRARACPMCAQWVARQNML